MLLLLLQVQYLSSRKVDVILVMSNGEIVEQGRYMDLVRKGGLFTSLVDAQNQTAAVQEEETRDDVAGAAAAPTVAAAEAESKAVVPAGESRCDAMGVTIVNGWEEPLSMGGMWCHSRST